jgi:hypothetical protein
MDKWFGYIERGGKVIIKQFTSQELFEQETEYNPMLAIYIDCIDAENRAEAEDKLKDIMRKRMSALNPTKQEER